MQHGRAQLRHLLHAWVDVPGVGVYERDFYSALKNMYAAHLRNKTAVVSHYMSLNLLSMLKSSVSLKI
jgi:hypothetical protein